jgi:outer membrane protein W
MLKKTFLNIFMGITVIAGTHTASAYHVRKAFSFYGGLQGGLSSYLAKINETNKPGNTYDTSSFSLGDMAPAIGGFAGFNYTFHNLVFAGLSIDGMYHFMKSQNNVAAPVAFNANKEVMFQTKDSFGGDIVIGKVLKAGLSLFASVGPRFTKFTHEQKISSAQPQWTKSEDKRLPGVSLTAGFDIPLDDHVGVGFSFSHQRYKTMTVEVPGHTNNHSITSTMRPVINQAMLRLRFS